MTKDKWDKFKDQKCEKGVPFTLGIFQGIKHRENSMGLVAGSTSFYQKFRDVYYDFIKEFHGFRPGFSTIKASEFSKDNTAESKHLKTVIAKDSKLPDLTFGKSFMVSSKSLIKNCKFSETNQRMIKNIKFSVRRNLEKYPFGVQMKLQERVQLMIDINKVTNKLKDDLAGTFYRIKNMRQRDEEELKEFLFKKLEKNYGNVSHYANNYTSSSNSQSDYTPEDLKFISDTELFSDWPYGRALYVNKDKSFAIKVGNVDHLEIMSFQDRSLHGLCDIETNFKNLMRGVGHLDQDLSFAFDENIGYPTSVIKNLGVIDIQIKFSPKYYKFYQTRLTPATVAKKFNVDLEISQKSDEDPLVLRNKIKFGMTESQIVQDLVNCLQAFFKFEDDYSLRFEVEYQIPSYIDTCHKREIKEEDKNSMLAQWFNFEIQLQQFHQGLIEDKKYKSQLDKILTKNIWSEYQGQKCKFGFSFNDTVVEGISLFQTRFSERKIVAGSQDSYRKFGKFYLNCLKHFGDKRAEAFEQSIKQDYSGTKANKRQDKQEYKETKYDKEDDALVRKVELSVRRNLNGYPLAAAMTKNQRAEIRDKVFDACKQFQGPLKTQIYKRDGDQKQKKPASISNCLEYMNSSENGELVNKNEEAGSAIIYNQDASFKILVNDIDHLEITLRKEKTSISETVEQFHKILKQLDNQVEFARDDVLGYVTARPYDLGYTKIEVIVELKDLQSMGQDLESHIKGKYTIKAARKFSKNESENSSSQDASYELTNLLNERGQHEHTQIQDMFLCMREVFDANKKYSQFNKIKKVEHVLGKSFEEIFPPRSGTQPYIFKEKMITKQLWDEQYEKGKKQCQKGKTFGACMFPGFIDQENKMALCAQSVDSYEAFKELFDKFIVAGPRQKEFVCGGYQNIQINTDQLKNVRRISISVIRNITGFPLVPGMSKDERNKLMLKIEKSCEEFEDDLKGIFYKLEDISESDKKIVQNISMSLPEEGSFQHHSGQGKDWPTGRAIFTNIDQTFFIHVNNSDHMKITFTKDNVNIQDFLERFMIILQKIELVCKFQFSQKHGYFTTYPYQLRFVDFKILVDDSREINADSSQTKTMAKESDCELIRSDEGWLTLKNLNSDNGHPATSEQQQIQNTINLTQKILKKLKHNEDLKKGYDEQLTSAKSLKTYDVFMSKPEMKIAEYLDKEMWEEYNLMSCELGVSFKNIVFPGIKDLEDQTYTLCASSLSCYKLYHKLFERYLQKNHSSYSQNANHPEMVSVSFNNTDFKTADSNLIKQVIFKVRRNFAGIPIGPGLTKDRRSLVLDIVEDLCRSYHGTDEGKFYRLEGIKDEDKKELEGIDFEKKTQSFLTACKINDDWPQQRGIFINKDKTFVIKVNFLDHLEISYAVQETGFMQSLDKFQDILSHLETKSIIAKKEGPFQVISTQGSNVVEDNQIVSQCRFAYDQKLGYITALPKLINEFSIRIYLKIHEDMKTVESTTSNHQASGSMGYDDNDFEDYGGFKGYGGHGGFRWNNQTYTQILKQNKFVFIENKEGEVPNGQQKIGSYSSTKFEYNVIGNVEQYAISEQVQLQNAINCLQKVFDKYAPTRFQNPFLQDEMDD